MPRCRVVPLGKEVTERYRQISALSGSKPDSSSDNFLVAISLSRSGMILSCPLVVQLLGLCLSRVNNPALAFLLGLDLVRRPNPRCVPFTPALDLLLIEFFDSSPWALAPRDFPKARCLESSLSFQSQDWNNLGCILYSSSATPPSLIEYSFVHTQLALPHSRPLRQLWIFLCEKH